MKKPFPRHFSRLVEELNGTWDFTFLHGCDLEKLDPTRVTYSDKMAVPAAFDATPRYAGLRGTAIYRTWFQTQPERNARLHFEAVSMWCQVYVDGVLLREHDCGYTGFWCEVPAAESPNRELVVVVDNRFDFERVPLHEEYFDFYQWGGMIRGVWLHHVPESFIESVVVTTEDWKAGDFSAKITLQGPLPEKIELGCVLDEQPLQTYAGLLPFEGRVQLRLQVPNPKPWSLDAPHLHTLRVVYGADDIIVRFGLRDFKTDGPRLIFNEKPIMLKGFNRHESHPQFGPALPEALLLNDLQQLKDLGCNFVRGSHYPQDQRFLDLCDELGLLVWEETLGWQQNVKHLTNEKYLARHKTMVEEMIAASINHPSVVIWGFLNECTSQDVACRPAIQAIVTQFHQLDPSRPVTFATFRGVADVCQDLVDLISINLYPGWYVPGGIEKPLETIPEGIRKQADYFAEKYPHKPLIISEIGAEGLYGWHDAMNGFWTEEYQAEHLRTSCLEALSNDKVQGILLWHFSDARTYAGGYSLGRPRAYNNKGTLDEYRRPKLAAKAVRECFQLPAFESSR